MMEFLLAIIGKLMGSVNLLIEKISNAIGRHFDPKQKIRMAKATAEENRILAMSEIEIAELYQRAEERSTREKMKEQLNMENVIQESIPHRTDNAAPGNINEDWITNFFDKCRIVSDAQMQELWAKILAGENNNPGSFSRKTVNIMADLDTRDAELFTNLCRFVWDIDNDIQPLVFDVHSPVYNEIGINFNSLSQLESLGLVRYSGVGNFHLRDLPSRVTAFYRNRQVTLDFTNSVGNQLDEGQVLLTQSGRELFRILDVQEIEGFFDYVCDRWANQGILLTRR